MHGTENTKIWLIFTRIGRINGHQLSLDSAWKDGREGEWEKGKKGGGGKEREKVFASVKMHGWPCVVKFLRLLERRTVGL